MDETCDYDGVLNEYRFGPTGWGKPYWSTQAMSLAAAIRRFRMGAPFPHTFAADPDDTEKQATDGEGVNVPIDFGMRQGYRNTKAWMASKPGAVIPVSVFLGRDKEAEVVALMPVVDHGMDAETPHRLLTTALSEAGGQDSSGTAMVVSNGDALVNQPRTELEEQTVSLALQLQKLEIQKAALQAHVAKVQAELARRLEQVWMIELFLGSNERVHVLREGEPAPAETPITLRQRVMVMMEEVALHQVFHPVNWGQGDLEFDYTNVKDFDNWLLADPSHLDQIFPWPKGVCALKVRRQAKRRSDSHMFDERDKLDAMTYLLVRNGENLYRLWVDVVVWPRLFMAAEDAEKKDHWDEPSKRLKTFYAGALAVQGLLERSTLLHPLPGNQRVSVFRPGDGEFQFIRDFETDKVLVNNDDDLAHMTWKGYRDWLNKQVAPGVRVMLDIRDRGRLEERLGFLNKNIHTWPDQNQVHVIDEKVTGAWSRGEWSLLYLPDQPVYSEGWHEHERTRRVRFRVYSDEIVPIDFLSWRVLQHLMASPWERARGTSWFWWVRRWYLWARREAERERPFIDLVLNQCGFDLDDDHERARAERLLRWWKRKVKMNRSLKDDEPKALRMIATAMRRGQDYDEDPERMLLQSRRGARTS